MKIILTKLLEAGFTIVRFAKTKRCWYIVGILLSYVLVGVFFSNFYLQFPILLEIRSPIVKRTVKVEKVKDKSLDVNILPTLTIITKVDDTQIIDIIAGIHILESNNGTKGLAVACKNKGMHNEVGYSVSSGFCFKDESTELLTLKNWFTKRLATGRTVADCMCEYNLGTVGLVNCAYYQDFLAL